MPPDVGYLTDEEHFDDDNLGTSVVSDIAGSLEIAIPDDNDNSIISDKKSRKRKREISVVWTNETPSYTFGTLGDSSKRNSDTLAAETNNESS